MNYLRRFLVVILPAAPLACAGESMRTDLGASGGSDDAGTDGSSSAASASGSGSSADTTLSTSVSASTTFTTSTAGESTTTTASTSDAPTSDGETGGSGSETGGATACDGLGAQGLLLWTTLDDAAAVAAPAVGAGTGAMTTAPVDDFVSGLDGDAVRLDASGERVTFPQHFDGVDNIDFERGTIDFCYQPQFEHIDSLGHEFFGALAATGGGLRMRKAGGNNANAFNVVAIDASGAFGGELLVTPSEYALSPGEWVRITVSWDFTVPDGEQNMRAYIDGVELIDADPPTGPLNMPSASPGAVVAIGAFNAKGNSSADALFDDFKLYDDALAP